MHKSKIITRFDPPPIPVRHFDWRAYEDDGVHENMVGWGSTEQEAKEDLERLIEEHYEWLNAEEDEED
jgi:hypothetical protein